VLTAQPYREGRFYSKVEVEVKVACPASICSRGVSLGKNLYRVLVGDSSSSDKSGSSE